MLCRRVRVPACSAGLFVCVAALAPIVHAADLARALDSVKLTFHWPDSLKSEVSYTVKRRKTFENQTQEFGASGSYSLVTTQVDDGLLIRIDNQKFRATEFGVPPGLWADLQKFFLRSTVVLPDFVVAGSGQFVRLEKVDAYRRKTESGLRGLLARYSKHADQRIAQAVMETLSKTRLRKMVEDNWKRDVADWSAAQFNHGDVYEMRRNTRLQVLGDTEVPVISTARFVDRVSCGGDSRPKNCVRLRMRSTVDSKALARSRQSYLERTARSGAEKSLVKDFRSSLTVWLVTEPDTLIPHSMRSRKETAMVTVSQGVEQVSKGLEEIEMTYRYPAAAGTGPPPAP